MSTPDILRSEEGKRLDLYQDTRGIWTIGIGYNIQARGLPADIVEELFKRDMASLRAEACKIPEFANLDPVRQGVLERMVFQMGLHSVMGFTGTRAALARQDWKAAHDGMLGSAWHRETTARCEREANRILTGEE